MSKSNKTPAEIQAQACYKLKEYAEKKVEELEAQVEYLLGVKDKYGKLYHILYEIANKYDSDAPKKLRKIDEFIMAKADERFKWSIEK